MIKKLINKFILWRFKSRLSDIEQFKKFPIKAQNRVLLNLLLKAKDTEFGKKYNFKKITDYNTFKNRIPLCTYEEIENDISLIRHGNSNLFWPGKTKWFAMSSGTTQFRSKFIPVTSSALKYCHFKAGKDMLSIYFKNYPSSNLFTGKVLKLGGSHKAHVSNSSFYGDLSSILIHNLPYWAHFSSSPSLKTSLLDEWEIKLRIIIKESINQNITGLAGVPSWMLVLLQKILKTTGKQKIIDIWPNLEYFAHGGVSFIPYRKQFNEIIGKKINYLEIYNASEGFFGIQDKFNSDELLLMLDYGIFYEFIPMSKFNSSKSNEVISLKDVKLGKNYAIIISTNSGLWRYIIGDTVRFTSLKPYRFKISGRTKHFINTFGEEIIIDNAQQAILKACKVTNASIKEYTAGPIYMESNRAGSHQWIIEFSKHPNDLNEFASTLDTTLKNINSDYEAKRHNNMTLYPPLITVAKKGLFFKWMEKRGKLGGQNKVPRLSNTREYLDSLLELNSSL